MNDQRDRAVILEALSAIAPEADLAALAADADVREALDFDSMDVLHFATALRDRFGVDVPEADYAQIVSVNGCLRYLQAHAVSPPTHAPGESKT